MMKRLPYLFLMLLPGLLLVGCQPVPDSIDSDDLPTDSATSTESPADTTTPAETTTPADTGASLDTKTRSGSKAPSPTSEAGAGLGEPAVDPLSIGPAEETAAAPDSGKSADSGQTTFREVTRETTEALKSFGDFTAEQKQAFVAEMRGELDRLNGSIEKLQQQGSELAGEARQQWEKQLATLREKRDAVRSKLPAIEQAGDDAWQELRDGVRGAWREMEEAYQAIRESQK